MENSALTVSVQSTYLPEHSVVGNNAFLWWYKITINNESDELVQLLYRNWNITDMMGHIEEVRGPGVIGLQPLIQPKKEFSYSSFCQLATPQGLMEGHYEMQAVKFPLQDQENPRFIVKIPQIFLTSPACTSDAFRLWLH